MLDFNTVWSTSFTRKLGTYMFNMANLIQKEVSSAFHFMRVFLYWVAPSRPIWAVCKDLHIFVSEKNEAIFIYFFRFNAPRHELCLAQKSNHPKVNSWAFLKYRISISTFIRSTETTPEFFAWKSKMFECCWGREGRFFELLWSRIMEIGDLVDPGDFLRRTIRAAGRKFF